MTTVVQIPFFISPMYPTWNISCMGQPIRSTAPNDLTQIDNITAFKLLRVYWILQEQPPLVQAIFRHPLTIDDESFAPPSDDGDFLSTYTTAQAATARASLGIPDDVGPYEISNRIWIPAYPNKFMKPAYKNMEKFTTPAHIRSQVLYPILMKLIGEDPSKELASVFPNFYRPTSKYAPSYEPAEMAVLSARLFADI